MVKNIQLLRTLTIYFLIAWPACLVIGCMPTEREELEPEPTTTAEIFDDATDSSFQATVTDAEVVGEATLPSEFSAVVVEPGVPFELSPGETVRLGDSNTDLTFEAIVLDGRCPINVACIWEGVAEVQFLLASNNRDNTLLTLKIPGLVETPYTDNPFVEQAGFRFNLLQLEPYPSVEDQPQPSEYTALLIYE